MKINLTEFSSQSIETSGIAAKKMRLSDNAQSMLFQMFTKNVYSNPIGTIVREITSNCFDSHVEAGVKDIPVVIRKSLDKETDTHYISFIDFGVGMSPDRIYNIYGVYFESTKRVDNEQIGGFGIGAKSILAYKRSTGLGEGEYDNSFYVITNYDRRKYVYMIYEGLESPEIALLHEEPTTETNGTEIRIPVLYKDIDTFVREMQRQLYYFENIVFEGFDNYTRYIQNDYQILQAKTFLFRGTAYESAIHVCLGRVAYPIDYSALGLSRHEFQIPIALKLNVGDIGVTVSRESLDYSEKTIRVLKEKLEEAKQEIVSMLSKQYEDVVSLEDYFEATSNFGSLKLANVNINLSNFIDKKSVDFKNFRYKDLPQIPNNKTLFNALFGYKRYGSKEGAYSSTFNGGYDGVRKYYDILYYTDDSVFNRKVIKQSYLKSKHNRYYVVTKKSLYEFHILKTIVDLFQVSFGDVREYDATTDTATYTPLFDRLVAVRDEYFEVVKKYGTDYDELEVPEDFVVRRSREKLSTDILKSTIPVKFIGGYSKTRVSVKHLVEFNGTIFYGTQDDEHKLTVGRRVYRALFDGDYAVTSYGTFYGKDNPFNLTKKRGIMFVMVSKNNLKIFKHCKKAFHIDEIKHRMLYRKEDMIMKYYNIHGLLDRYKTINDFYKSSNLQYINQDLFDFAQQLKHEIGAIPAAVKDINLRDYADELEKYFDMSKALPLDRKLSKMVEKLEAFDELNKPILYYIDMPYRSDNLNDAPILIDILKKVMKFDV